MTDSTESAVRNVGSLLSLGSLLIAAAVLSYGIHLPDGEWPAGFDGWIGALFLVSGVVFVGASLVLQVRARRAAREASNPRF